MSQYLQISELGPHWAVEFHFRLDLVNGSETTVLGYARGLRHMETVAAEVSQRLGIPLKRTRRLNNRYERTRVA